MSTVSYECDRCSGYAAALRDIAGWVEDDLVDGLFDGTGDDAARSIASRLREQDVHPDCDPAAHRTPGGAAMTIDPTPRVHLLAWDCRQQPDLARLAQLVDELSGGRVHITEAETGDDQYAVVIADHPVSDADAHRLYRAHLMGDDHA